MVPACGANFSRRRKNYEDCMYRSTFGRIMVERHNFAATVKKNRMESRLSSVGLLIIVRKKSMPKVFSNCILLNVFCKGTKIYSIQKASNEKSEIFRLRNFFLTRKHTNSNASEQVLSCWVMIIPIPLPQHQHTFCQRRRFDQDCPGLRQVEMNKMKSA